MSSAFEVRPSGALRGSLAMPGDKSVSHRALMLAGLARGETRIRGLLRGEDVLATRRAMRALGVSIEETAEGDCCVEGVGLDGLSAPVESLDLGNSGTAMRLLAGILSGQRFSSTLVGDESLMRRPMQRIVEPLRRMGAQIEADGGRPPLRIRGIDSALAAISYESPIASAQVKSCVLLAGLYANGTTRVREPVPSRDHTERMLRAFDYPIEFVDGWWQVSGSHPLHSPGTLRIPGDISSAAFWIVAASVIPGSDLELTNVGVNPARAGILTILRSMGAHIEQAGEREVGGEVVADLRVRAGSLRGVTVEPHEVPAAIDEFPALFVAAAFAEGTTTMRGAAELRKKESDRIAVMVKALRAMGVEAEERADGAVIHGGPVACGEVDSTGDHRCAMALAVAGAAGEGCVVRDVANVKTSYPEFVSHALALDVSIAEVD